jgi:hypothetical protein
LPGAFFAAAPWVAARAKPGTVPWWHDAVKQEVLEIPPLRSVPWQEVHGSTDVVAMAGCAVMKLAEWFPLESTRATPPPVPPPLEQPNNAAAERTSAANGPKNPNLLFDFIPSAPSGGVSGSSHRWIASLEKRRPWGHHSVRSPGIHIL